MAAQRSAQQERKQEVAIAALLTQRSIEDAARASGIGEKTLRRWLQTPTFSTAYRNARRQAVGQATARLQQATSAAVSVLLTIMLDGNAPTSSRIRAAQAVIDTSFRAVELDDIEARVAELESLKEKKDNTAGEVQ